MSETDQWKNKIYCGDCLQLMQDFDDNSINTIITDPPYGLKFMGKKWDYKVPSVEIWEECLRVLKPGGTALIFAGSRTQHRMAINVEDAGFILFDVIMYLYGSGFPKSTNLFKQLTKKGDCGIMVAEEQKERMGHNKKETEPNTKYPVRFMWKTDISQTINIKNKQREILQSGLSKQSIQIQQPQSTENVWQRQSGLERWGYIQTCEGELQRCKICALSERISIDGEEGWLCNGASVGNSTAYKQIIKQERSCPSYRPRSQQQQIIKSNIILKQYNTQEIRGDADEWQGWGTHLKPAYEPIICARKPNDGTYAENALEWGVGGLNIDGGRIPLNGEKPPSGSAKRVYKNNKYTDGKIYGNNKETPSRGRYPANVILDEVAAEMLDEQSGILTSGSNCIRQKEGYFGEHGGLGKAGDIQITHGDSGGASRFFYCAKASKAERNRGCEELEEEQRDLIRRHGQAGTDNPYNRGAVKLTNSHPTVKPLKLMEYLCTLTKTPTGGLVLDPFCGSGSTCVACIKTNRDFIGIDKERDSCAIAQKRIDAERQQVKLNL